MFLRTFERPPDRNLTYLFGPQGTTAQLAAVDPGADVAPLLEAAGGRRIRMIFATHGHHDHVEGLVALRDKTGAPICGHRLLGPEFEKAGIPLDMPLTGGQQFELDGVPIRILYTPGHHPAAISILVGEKILFTGDTLFVGDCGRADLPGGDSRTLYVSMQMYRGLDDDITIYPGHNYGKKPFSTLRHEKKTNPALLAESLEEFEALP